MAKDQSRVHPFIYPVIEQAGGGPLSQTLTGDVTYDQYGPRVLNLSPGGADRIVRIPDAEPNHKGDRYVIRNSGSDGFSISVVEVGTGFTLAVLANGDRADIWDGGTGHVVSISQATFNGGDTEPSRIVGGRRNSFTADDDTITAAASAGAYIDFAGNVVIPGGTLKAGTRVSILASVLVSDAAAGSATLKTKLSIGPRDVWTLRIDTNSNAEAYGVNVTLPVSDGVAYTSDASATKAEIADGIAAAWNADAGCSAVATAVSDGVDTVTFTSITDRFLKLAEDENAGKMTLTQTVSSTTLVESTAVDQAEDDFQALDFELNSIAAPSATSEVAGVGSWMTSTGGTLANSVVMLLPTDFDTTSDLVIRAWALWSASEATTTARLVFLSVRSE